MELFRTRPEDEAATTNLASAIGEVIAAQEEVAVVCIGTDRSTGDALGPLVGSELSGLNLPGVTVYGTLEEPVHAANLRDVTKLVQGQFVVAVDACLGLERNVGSVVLKSGVLRPGTGVKKDLGEIGDAHIVGVVNVGGFMEYFVLQNTRLSRVMRLSRLIAESLGDALEVWSMTKKNAASGATLTAGVTG